MSKRSCPACNRSFIKGQRVQFASRTGLRPALVCGPCAASGVTIVQDKSADLSRCIECERNPAVLCMACVGRTIQKTRQ